MKYEVRCECGKTHTVSAADAGSSFRCPCGRPCEVPALHQLRTSDGDAALSPLGHIRSAFLNNRLPGTNKCVGCGMTTEQQRRVKIVCERKQNQSGTSQAEVVGCLIGPLLGLFLRWLRASTSDEEAVIVPLPLCQTCQPKLNTPAAIQQAVRQIPDYASLLDRYPNAELSLVG